MTVTDVTGYAVTASADMVKQYDDAVAALLLFAEDVSEVWDATVAGDARFALGQIGRAYLRCLSSEGPDAEEARRILEALGDDNLTDREQRHLEAARAYTRGDLCGASDRLGALSVEYPRDALALAVGHQLDFFCGDALGLRDRVGRTLYAWDREHPWFGFVLGMQAFGLEECGLYPQAEAAGMAALDAERRDVWALHAVVHVHEMQGRVAEGLRFMDSRRADWTKGNFFAVHNSWHEALFALDSGDVERALDIYDSKLHHAESPGVALEMVDAAALLWRMYLDGVEAGDRWTALADAWGPKAGEPWYVFNDVHAVMSLVGAGRLGEARAWCERLRRYPGDVDPRVTNKGMTADVGLPVCAAVVAFGEGRYRDAVDLLHPIRKTLSRLGGSHAQRDAFARTLLEAAARAEETALVRALVSERLAVKPSAAIPRRLRD